MIARIARIRRRVSQTQPADNERKSIRVVKKGIRNERNYHRVWWQSPFLFFFFLHERIHDSTILSINTPSSAKLPFHPNLSLAKPLGVLSCFPQDHFSIIERAFERIRLVVRVIFFALADRLEEISSPRDFFLTLFFLFFIHFFFSFAFTFSRILHSFAHLSRSCTLVIFWDRCIQLWYIYT